LRIHRGYFSSHPAGRIVIEGVRPASGGGANDRQDVGMTLVEPRRWHGSCWFNAPSPRPAPVLDQSKWAVADGRAAILVNSGNSNAFTLANAR
jgi:N-acetylglutamate synthase/N-acetylornithine aminotransferase